MNYFEKNFRRILESKSMMIEDLSYLTNINYDTLRKKIKSQREFKIEEVIKIITILNISFEDLFIRGKYKKMEAKK